MADRISQVVQISDQSDNPNARILQIAMLPLQIDNPHDHLSQVARIAVVGIKKTNIFLPRG